MRFTSDTLQADLLKNGLSKNNVLLKKKCTGRKRAGRVGACMRER